MNLQAVIARTRGMIRTPDATLAEHASPPPPIGVVIREHLLPLLALNGLVSFALLLLLPGDGAGAIDPGSAAIAVVADIGLGIVSVWIISAIVRYHARRLGGSGDPRAAFVLTALAMSPLFVAVTFAQLLSFVGLAPMLIMLLAGLIYTFVLIYRGSGRVLAVPDKARGRHIAAVVLTQMLVSFAVSLLLTMVFMPGLPS